MDIILKNVNVKVQSIVYIEPQVLNNLPCDLQHTQYGYYLHKSANMTIVQFPSVSGKSYKLNSRFNASSNQIQALITTNALDNTSYEGEFESISNVIAKFNKYGEQGTPTQTGYYDVEFTAANNGYLVCYQRNEYTPAKLIEV